MLYLADVIDSQADAVRVERLLATWLVFIYGNNKFSLRIALRLLCTLSIIACVMSTMRYAYKMPRDEAKTANIDCEITEVNRKGLFTTNMTGPNYVH